MWGVAWAALVLVLFVALVVRAVRRPKRALEGATAPVAERGPGRLDRFRRGLASSRGALATRLGAILGGGLADRDLRERIEEALIESDVGVRTATSLLDSLAKVAIGETTAQNRAEPGREGAPAAGEPAPKPIEPP